MLPRIDSATITLDTWDNGIRRTITFTVPYPLRPEFEREVRVEWDRHSHMVLAQSQGGGFVL